MPAGFTLPRDELEFGEALAPPLGGCREATERALSALRAPDT